MISHRVTIIQCDHNITLFVPSYWALKQWEITDFCTIDDVVCTRKAMVTVPIKIDCHEKDFCVLFSAQRWWRKKTIDDSRWISSDIEMVRALENYSMFDARGAKLKIKNRNIMRRDSVIQLCVIETYKCSYRIFRHSLSLCVLSSATSVWNTQSGVGKEPEKSSGND